MSDCTIFQKHFLNSPSTIVLDSLKGLCALNPFSSLDSDNKVVHIASQDRSKVALICGGGSGHEPAHAGFVGNGLLTAAICGNVFASPSASQVRRGIDLVDNDKGTVIIVKNYTGDVLNFGLAKEQHAALHPAKSDRIRFVIVGDDVAVGKTQGSIVGRRGLAGTVLVYKTAGALAERGASLDQVHDIAQWVASRIVTIGVALEHCHIPGTSPASSHLSSGELEIGLGIHNESGHQKVSPVPPIRELIPRLLEMLMSTTDTERSFLPFRNGNKDHVILLINNLGGLSNLEFGCIVAETKSALDEKGVVIRRLLAGTFMTSLNMPGFSLTLLLLEPESSAPTTSTLAPPASLILDLLDDPCNAPGWTWSPRCVPLATLNTPTSATTAKVLPGLWKVRATDPQAFMRAITCACKALVDAEPEITRMDLIAGDGDCGTTLKNGAEGVLARVADGTIHGEDVVGAVLAVAQVAEDKMGGTSGALYSIFFSALAQGLERQRPVATDAQHTPQPTTGPAALTPPVWHAALAAAQTRLLAYTRARPPASRTLVDPLAAFVACAPHAGLAQAVADAADAAVRSRDIELVAAAGRSAYLDPARLAHERVPDPGAWGVKVLLEGLLQGWGV